MVSQRFDRIHIENGIHVLNDRSKTLQTHSCINILLLQLCVVAVSVIVELGEHIVPDLHVAVAVASYRTVRFAASVLLSPVIVYLRARTARA